MRTYDTSPPTQAPGPQTSERRVARYPADLAGILPIKSVKMARYMNDNVPGIDIPDALIETIAQAPDVADVSVTIAAETIATVSPWCAGIHVMALGWERRIPLILERAGVR